jgi:putative DNA-invertase from lambdoid prophage Rac
MIGLALDHPDSGRYWFYARRSTKKQTESIDQQVKDFEKYFDLPEGAKVMPYVSDTMSATKRKIDERPNFSQMFDQLQAGDHLVVWRLDRLGRNFLEMLQTCEKLADKKVWLHSIKEMNGQRLDMSSMEAKVFVQILMIGHQMYVHYMRMNVKRSIEARKEAGLAYSVSPLFGRKRIKIPGPKGKPYRVDVWDEEFLEKARILWEMRQAGKTWVDIAEWVYAQRPQWTRKGYHGRTRGWVEERKHYKRAWCKLRSDFLIRVVESYDLWHREQCLPGMKNDLNLLTFMGDVHVSGSPSEAVLEPSEEPDPFDESPQPLFPRISG